MVFDLTKRRAKIFIRLFLERKIFKIFNQLIYFKRVAVPVQKDLINFEIPGDFNSHGFYQILHISEIENQDTYKFLNWERDLLKNHYLENGYHGFVLIREGTVVGDVWYLDFEEKKKKTMHPDLKLLGLEPGFKDVYAFDMFVDPAERGSNVGCMFMGWFLFELKIRGFLRIFGYYWADYFPALWMHRVLKFKELKKVKMWRFFLIRGSY